MSFPARTAPATNPSHSNTGPDRNRPIMPTAKPATPSGIGARGCSSAGKTDVRFTKAQCRACPQASREPVLRAAMSAKSKRSYITGGRNRGGSADIQQCHSACRAAAWRLFNREAIAEPCQQKPSFWVRPSGRCQQFSLAELQLLSIIGSDRWNGSPAEAVRSDTHVVCLSSTLLTPPRPRALPARPPADARVAALGKCGPVVARAIRRLDRQ